MRKLKLFFACLLMAVLSIGQVWGATYFEDTFSNVGNSDNQSISSRSGWGSFSKCYSQGNSGLRIGSSSAAGSVTKTAMTNISGTKDIKVTVYTAKYNTNANSFTVSVANGTISEVTGVGTLSAGKITISPSNNAGVTSTTSAATWTDAYKTVFTITGASSSTTITFASNKRVILGPVKIEDATSSDPSVEVAPSSLAFGSVEQNTSVAAKTFSVSGSNLTGAITISAPAGYMVSPTSITPSTGSIAATDVTVTPITSSIGTFNGDVTISGGGLSSNVTVGLTMTVTAPFDGEVLEIKNTDFATSYASANGDHEFGCITITSNQVGNYSSSIQFQKNTGYIYNKTSLGEIAKIEITKTGNNNLVVYEGTEENPTTSSITGVAVDNITTYTFSSGKSYFRIFCNNTGASNVTPIKVYYHPASYEVTLSAGSNGSLSATVDDAAIASGDDVEMCKTVTIAATPNEGYKIKSLTVTDEDDDEVEVTSNQFVMPAKAVTVAATFEATKALSSISLSGTHRAAFWQGEPFSSEGLIVTAHYEGADDEVVTPASISSPDMSTPGEKTITVTYTEGTTKSNTYTINVKALPITQGTAGTVADLIDIYDKLGNQSNLYIKGTIYKINGFYSEKYISYWITDSYDGEANPNHSNEFELYNGLDFDGADFTAATDLEVGQYVIVKGNLTKYSSTYEFATGNEIVSRPKVLKGIALSGTYPTEFTQGDEFSSEGLVVTASYNYGDPVAVIPTSITGYNMATTGNQTVTVSYTEGGVTKTATYGISVAAPDLCEHKATISKGAEVNGTFSLSVSGEQCLDELPGKVISTILTAEPAEHYHLASVTATVGTVGAIANNECTISDINASTTITAVFEEDDKVTVKFAMGTENATGDVPADVADQYAGQSVTLPANPFTYTGSPIKVFGGWKHSLTNEVKQPGSYTITAADAAEDNITFTAVWNDLSPWATVYTSNVTLSGSQNVNVTITVDEEDTNFAGVKMNKGAAATFTIPAGTTHLYAHMAAWNGEGQSVTVSGDCFDEPKGISIIADANVSGSSTTFDIDDAKAPTDYFKEIVLDKEVTEPTEITITAASGKRFVLFGVNQVGGIALESIAISGTASNLEYNDGDHFNPAGLVVMGHYSNGSDAAISDGIDWAFDPDPLTEGTESVSVTATVDAISSLAFVVNGLTVSGAAPLSPWATVYTSNVELSGSQNVKVTITVDEEDKNFDGVKMNKAAAATFTIPAGTTNLYAHMAAWNGEAQTVTVSGDCFDADKSIDIVADANISGSGTTYDIDDAKAPTDYFKEIVLDKEVTEPTEITITAASGKRFVLFGVNQVGGVLPVLKSIEISGDLTNKSGYKVGDDLDLDGLTVSAIYTLNEVDQAPVDVTSLVNWSYDPLVEGQTSVTITATLEDKSDDITISDLEAVASADPKIYVSTLSVDFGSVEVGEAVPANETVTVTLTNVANATATLGGTNPDAFSIDKEALTASGDITVSVVASTASAANYSATLTISDDAAAATAKEISLSFAVTAPVVNDEYELVSDVNTLAAGDQIIIVAENAGTYYTLDGSITSQYFPSTAVSISAGIITAPSTSAIILGKDEDNWTMSMGGQLIGATAAKKASLGNTTTATNTWTIAIAENVATITNTTTTYGSLQFNYNGGSNSRFLNYTSAQTAVAIYKKVAPEPPTPSYTEVRNGLTEGWYYTMCLDKAVTAVQGASIWRVLSKAANGTDVILEEVIGTLDAGRPYIFRAAANTLEVAYTGDAVLAPVTEDNNGLVGSFTEEPLAQNSNHYIIYNNALYYVNSDNVKVGAHRAYLDMTGVPAYSGAASAPGRRRVTMAVHGEQVATGMDALDASEAPVKMIINGQLFILRGEKLYDATGRLVK